MKKLLAIVCSLLMPSSGVMAAQHRAALPSLPSVAAPMGATHGVGIEFPGFPSVEVGAALPAPGTDRAITMEAFQELEARTRMASGAQDASNPADSNAARDGANLVFDGQAFRAAQGDGDASRPGAPGSSGSSGFSGGGADGEGGLPSQAPFISLPGVIFPGRFTTLTAVIPQTQALLRRMAQSQGPKYVVVGTEEEDRRFSRGTLVKVSGIQSEGDKVVCEMHGLREVAIERDGEDDGHPSVVVTYPDVKIGDEKQVKLLANMLAARTEQFLKLDPIRAAPILAQAMGMKNPVSRVNGLAQALTAVLELPLSLQQQLLNVPTLQDRARLLFIALNHRVEGLKREKAADMDPPAASNDSPLSEEQAMLEEKQAHLKEMQEIDLKIKDSKMPAEIKKKALAQLERLKRMHPQSAEAEVTRTWIDAITAVPWGIHTQDNLDLGKARVILDRDHFGLEMIKERILMYLAWRMNTGGLDGKTLVFAGPPGVGKTSVIKSIAESMGRKYVRMALGGVRDEADFRGHRKTYIGALPGQIVRKITDAGAMNPVFNLDEIDKLGQDPAGRGDPSAALLEVLDPEQNFSFEDHYLGVQVDLSKVLFIATANDVSRIPRALWDRMEVIQFPSYTTEEKERIAQDYLIPKNRKKYGLPAGKGLLPLEKIRELIERWTFEAGVRDLNRMIAEIFLRGSTRGQVKGTGEPVPERFEDLEKTMGRRAPIRSSLNPANGLGVATALAVHPTLGGSMFKIQMVMTPGRGNIIARRHMKDDIQDSLRNVYDYFKSRAEELDIPSDAFAKKDLSATFAPARKTDGPSAGIALAAATYSVLKEIPVPDEVAFTGEFDLTGRVLAVGGIPEKFAAARRAGIKRIIFSAENIPDLDDVSEEIKREMTLVPVATVDEMLKEVFGKKDEAPPAPPSGSRETL